MVKLRWISAVRVSQLLNQICLLARSMVPLSMAGKHFQTQNCPVTGVWSAHHHLKPHSTADSYNENFQPHLSCFLPPLVIGPNYHCSRQNFCSAPQQQTCFIMQGRQLLHPTRGASLIQWGESKRFMHVLLLSKHHPSLFIAPIKTLAPIKLRSLLILVFLLRLCWPCHPERSEALKTEKPYGLIEAFIHSFSHSQHSQAFDAEFHLQVFWAFWWRLIKENEWNIFHVKNWFSLPLSRYLLLRLGTCLSCSCHRKGFKRFTSNEFSTLSRNSFVHSPPPPIYFTSTATTIRCWASMQSFLLQQVK